MKCFNTVCNYTKTRVINSRKTAQGRGVLRRRLCHKCKERYTSIEIYAYSNYPDRQKRAAINLLSS
jgi:transcriptional regulator NrdR family protein